MLAPRLLDEVLGALGESPSSDVEFTGADPVLASPLPLGEAGAACIAASALLAAQLFVERGGAAQRVGIAIDAAAAAMRSSRYLRVEGTESRRPAGGGGLGVYRTRDEGWIYFQRLFPHHRERLLSVLRCEETEEAIAQAVAAWDGLALEEAVVAAGASCGMVRSYAEWEQHPQAQAQAMLPLLEVVRIGESAPERLGGWSAAASAGAARGQASDLADSAGASRGQASDPADSAGASQQASGVPSRPLEGVRVLDLTRVLAGPTCARTLAEHGADVLRIGTRQWPDNDAMMRDTGFGKRSAVLDLRDAAQADTLRGLIGGADVFSQGYRPGSLAGLGFGPEEVAALRPGIVYVTISAFGHAGPWQARRGFDSVVQSVSGIAHEHAGPDGRPRFAPANPLDYMTGYLAAAGAMAALRRRARDGGSYVVRVSLAQTGRWLAGLERVDASQGSPDLPAARLEELMEVTETPFGRLRHLAPVVSMSGTQPRWELPSVPLDHDMPEWRKLGR